MRCNQIFPSLRQRWSKYRERSDSLCSTYWTGFEIESERKRGSRHMAPRRYRIVSRGMMASIQISIEIAIMFSEHRFVDICHLSIRESGLGIWKSDLDIGRELGVSGDGIRDMRDIVRKAKVYSI